MLSVGDDGPMKVSFRDNFVIFIHEVWVKSGLDRILSGRSPMLSVSSVLSAVFESRSKFQNN